MSSGSGLWRGLQAGGAVLIAAAGPALGAPLVVTTPQTSQVGIVAPYDSLDNYSDITVTFDPLAPSVGAVYAIGSAAWLRNNAGASIVAKGGFSAILMDSASGTDGNLGKLVNNGLISSDAQVTVGANHSIAQIVNTGTIVNTGSDPYSYALVTSGFVDKLTNTGTIKGSRVGLAPGSIGDLENGGLISGSLYGLWVQNLSGRIVNRGTIEGGTAISFFTSHAAHTITNAGTIRGLDGGAAIEFAEDQPGHLKLLTGSQIEGAVLFGVNPGDTEDSLDISGFAGSTILDVPGLDEVVAGHRSYVWDKAASQVAIFDTTGLDATAIGGDLSGMMGSLTDLVGTELGAPGAAGQSGVVVANYAAEPANPALAATDEAVRTQLDVTQPAGAKVWGGVIGGGNAGPGDRASLYGGIVAGSHARLGDSLTLGGLAGYVTASAAVPGDGTMLDTTTGVAGLYGEAQAGPAAIDFALLGGLSGHRGTRSVFANNAVETAASQFTTTFLSPSVGVSVPVLSGDMGDVLFDTRASYVGGLTSGYTETGSSMNLTVGALTIAVADARFGLEGRHSIAGPDGVTLTLGAKAGVLVQSNMGSASVPVTLLGQSIDVPAPGGSSYGLYGGVAVDAALTRQLGLTARVDASARNDGVLTRAAKLSLTGSF